jgi:hypothetical protein
MASKYLCFDPGAEKSFPQGSFSCDWEGVDMI